MCCAWDGVALLHFQWASLNTMHHSSYPCPAGRGSSLRKGGAPCMDGVALLHFQWAPWCLPFACHCCGCLQTGWAWWARCHRCGWPTLQSGMQALTRQQQQRQQEQEQQQHRQQHKQRQQQHQAHCLFGKPPPSFACRLRAAGVDEDGIWSTCQRLCNEWRRRAGAQYGPKCTISGKSNLASEVHGGPECFGATPPPQQPPPQQQQQQPPPQQQQQQPPPQQQPQQQHHASPLSSPQGGGGGGGAAAPAAAAAARACLGCGETDKRLKKCSRCKEAIVCSAACQVGRALVRGERWW